MEIQGNPWKSMEINDFGGCGHTWGGYMCGLCPTGWETTLVYMMGRCVYIDANSLGSPRYDQCYLHTHYNNDNINLLTPPYPIQKYHNMIHIYIYNMYIIYTGKGPTVRREYERWKKVR